MSSYLFIVKFELPLVIQAFLGQASTSGWVFVTDNQNAKYKYTYKICLTYLKSHLQFVLQEYFVFVFSN